jgi:hypothetical protein
MGKMEEDPAARESPPRHTLHIFRIFFISYSTAEAFSLIGLRRSGDLRERQVKKKCFGEIV